MSQAEIGRDWRLGAPLRRWWIGIGLAGISCLLAGFSLAGDDPRFLASYLVAWLFVTTLGLGGVFAVLVHHVSRAAWSVVVRRFAEHTGATLMLSALLFVPLVRLWSRLVPGEAGAGLHDAGPHNAWFSMAGWQVRSVVILAIWALLGGWLRWRSMASDSGDSRNAAPPRAASAPLSILYAVTVTLAGFDWILALSPPFASSIVGVYLFAGAAVAIYAWLSLLTLLLERPLQGALTVEHRHDLGKMLFGFVAFWAYIAFSQFLLIWYADLPEERWWFARRLEGGWAMVTVLLALGHFVLPFCVLLGRRAKRDRLLLGAASAWLLAMHLLDLFWLVQPAVVQGGPRLGWQELASLVGVASLWLAGFLMLLERPSLVAVGDPRLDESLLSESLP